MHRIPRVLLLLAFVFSLQGGEAHRRPFPGITHIKRTDSVPRPFTLHLVKIDLTTPGLRFKVSPPGGSREAVRQTTLDYLIQEQAQLAVNLHFFLPFPSADPHSNLIGLAASEGIIYSDFETPQQSYAIVPNAPAINIDRQNRAALLTHENALSAALWNAFAGSAQIIANGVPSVPSYKDQQHPHGLLTPGGPAYSNTKSWYAIPNARTIAGLSRDQQTLYLVTIDNAAPSKGLSLFEAAEILARDYAVHNAINLDGGGSTTLAMHNPATGEPSIVNVPSGTGNPRSVATSLAVFAPLDTTPPSTNHSFSSTPNPAGAYPANLTIELLSTDDTTGTGVHQIYLSISAQHPATVLSNQPHHTAIHLTTPGDYEITYFAADGAGNRETPKSISIRIIP